MTISRSVLLRMRNISDKICRENLNTHFMFSNLKKKDNVRKMWYSRGGHRCEYDTAHAFCMLANRCYRHTLRIRHTYCLFSTNIVTRKFPNISLYVHSLSYCRRYSSGIFNHLSDSKCVTYFMVKGRNFGAEAIYIDWHFRSFSQILQWILALVHTCFSPRISYSWSSHVTVNNMICTARSVT